MNDLAQKQIKGYELLERIGTGGFGAVYRAHQSTVGREVAIKVILPGHANQPEFIRRFEAEAQLVARLEHHHIVPLYDYWRDPEGAYLVMRWLRGGSLYDQIKMQGALSVEDATLMIEQIAGALHTAHRNHVIHRDIKPGNILLDEDSNAFVADFGIAKDHAVSKGVTEADAIVGSPDYLSPEQTRSEAVTPQTDIYSLGVVLYEMLEGKHPFSKESTIERLYKHLNEPLPDIASVDASIRDALNDVIQKATAKDPMQRFKDAMEMAQALRDAAQLDGSQVGTSLVELLTPREQEVLDLIIAGKSNREIAEKLVLSLATIKTYISKIYRKLNVRSRVQAIVKARELDLIVNQANTKVSSTSHIPEPENPYKGLRSFQAADEQDFFGRDKLIQKVLKRLQEDVKYRRFLAIVGPSGSGKSSVVKAGIIPAVWRGEISGSDNWYIVDMLPGRHPIDELEIALTKVASQAGININEHLQRDERGLARVANLILPDDDSELLIVVDQFEEVFTQTVDDQERQHFLDILRYAITDDRSRVRVVVTLRADYYDRPLQYVDFGQLIQNRTETVLPLSAEEIEQAVRQPANRVGVVFEDGLVSKVVSDVHFQPGALPLLQYALTELFERRTGRQLTLEAYEAIGGTGGALAKRADEIYLESDIYGQVLIRQLFLRLVTLGEGAEDTRRRADHAELLGIATDPALMDEIIDLYARSRLISLDNDPATRRPTVEVAHEAILWEWERLRQWLNDSRDDIRQERLIARDAEAWQEHNQDKSYLMTGTRLEQAEIWRETTELALTPLESEFIEASTTEAKAQEIAKAQRQKHEAELEQRARTVLRALVAVFAVAAIIAGGFGLFALNQRNDAIDARDSEAQAHLDAQTQAAVLLSVQSESEAEDGFFDRAVLLGLEALEYYPYTPQAEHALANAVSYNRALQQYTGHNSAVTSVDWSPDGTKVATSSTDNTVHVWDARTGEELLVIDQPEGITARCFDWALTVKWTPDGKQLLTINGDRFLIGSQDYDVILWDAVSGGEVERGRVEIANSAAPESGIEDACSGVADHYPTGQAAAFAHSGELLATVGGDNTAIIWTSDLETQMLVLNGHVNDVNGVAWSPDDTRITTFSEDGTIRIWDVATGGEIRVLDDYESAVNVTLWSSDGTQLVSGGDDGLVRIWDVETGTMLRELQPDGGIVWGLAWSSDELYLTTSTDDMTIRLWDIASDEVVATMRGHSDFASHLASSPVDGRIASAGADGVARIWNANPGTAWLRLPYDYSQVPDWSPDGQHAIFTVGDWLNRSISGELSIWDVRNRQPVSSLATDLDYASWQFGKYSPDGRLILANGASSDWPDSVAELAVVYLLDASSGEIVNSFEVTGGELGFVRAFDWSPDGAKFVVGTGEGTVHIFDITSNQPLSTSECGPWLNAVDWSPDGNHIALICGAISFGEEPWVEVIDVTDVANPKHALTLNDEDSSGFLSVAWSPDGTRIMTTGGDDEIGTHINPVLIWSAESGESLLSIEQHTGQVFWGSWSPDGNRIATGSTDGTTRIWDAQNGAPLLTLSTPNDWSASPEWSPDGQYLAVGTFSFNTPTPQEIWRVWQSTEDLIAYARDCCLFRDFTSGERQQFGLPER